MIMLFCIDLVPINDLKQNNYFGGFASKVNVWTFPLYILQKTSVYNCNEYINRPSISIFLAQCFCKFADSMIPHLFTFMAGTIKTCVKLIMIYNLLCVSITTLYLFLSTYLKFHFIKSRKIPKKKPSLTRR